MNITLLDVIFGGDGTQECGDRLMSNASWSLPWLPHENASSLVLSSVLPSEECTKLKLQYNNSTFINHLLSNVSCLDHAPEFTRSAAIKACVLSVMALLSFFGNAATILSIHRNRKHRLSTVYRLILQLSIADLFVTFFCLAVEAAWSYTVAWMAGNVACKLIKFMQMFSLYLSTFVLVLIGIDRFVAVRYPMKSLTAMYCNRFIYGAWILSAVFSIPQLIVFSVVKGPFIEEFSQCVTHGFYTEMWQEQLYGVISLFLNFIAPLVVLITTYVSTIFTIARSEKLFKAEVESCSASGGHQAPAPDINRRRLMQRAKMKSLRISVVIVVAFVIWWTPYYTMMIYFMFINESQDEEEKMGSIWSAIFFFGMSNSLVNPLIYGAFHLWKPHPRANSYRSPGFNREASTRRSTATHVSVRRCDSRSTRVTVARSNVAAPLPPDNTENTALVSLNCGGSVEARVVPRSVPCGEETSPAKLLLVAPEGKPRFPDLVLRYGGGVFGKGGVPMQTRI